MAPTAPPPALAQILLLGFICFCLPGMYNGLIAVGLGLSDQSLASTATSTLYGTMAVSSLVLAPGACNLLGPRLLLFGGGLTYVIYVFALIGNTDWDLASFWVVVFAGLLGVGASGLWTAQGQLIMAYPTQEVKASYLGYFWFIFSCGGVVGGLVVFISNFSSTSDDADDDDDDSTSDVSTATYVSFASIMAVGLLLTGLMAAPENVQRCLPTASLPAWPIVCGTGH